jgi:hypothetical protein
MLRRVRNREAGSAGKNLNRALALRNEFQQFEAMPVAQCFCNGGELSEERLLGTER